MFCVVSGIICRLYRVAIALDKNEKENKFVSVKIELVYSRRNLRTAD